MIRLIAVTLLVACSPSKAPDPWISDEALAFQRARDQHKAVVIDLTATWSVPSVELSHHLDTLRPELDRNFVPLRIDVSNDDDHTEELRSRYHVPVLPAVLFVDSDGTVLARLVNPPPIDDLRATIATAAAAAAKRRP